jgi:hypothetical protein
MDFKFTEEQERFRQEVSKNLIMYLIKETWYCEESRS